MAVTSYIKDGTTFWRIYINLRSKVDPTLRVQRLLIGFTSQEKAQSKERRLLVDLGRRLLQMESQGSPWENVIDLWEQDKKTYPSADYVETTILDHAALLRNWTEV